MEFTSDRHSNEGKEQKDSGEHVHGWVNRRSEIAKVGVSPVRRSLPGYYANRQNTVCTAEINSSTVCFLAHTVFRTPYRIKWDFGLGRLYSQINQVMCRCSEWPYNVHCCPLRQSWGVVLVRTLNLPAVRNHPVIKYPLRWTQEKWVITKGNREELSISTPVKSLIDRHQQPSVRNDCIDPQLLGTVRWLFPYI